MKIRDFLNNNATSVTVVAVIILVVVLSFMFSGGNDGTLAPPEGDYYWDLNDWQLIKVDLGSIPPVETESEGEQPAGVKAIIWSCGKCTPQDWKIVWVEKYNPDVKRKIVKVRKEPPPDGRMEILSPDSQYLKDKLVATLDSDDPDQKLDWVRFATRKGQKISQPPICSDDSRPQRCIVLPR